MYVGYFAESTCNNVVIAQGNSIFLFIRLYTIFIISCDISKMFTKGRLCSVMSRGKEGGGSSLYSQP